MEQTIFNLVHSSLERISNKLNKKEILVEYSDGKQNQNFDLETFLNITSKIKNTLSKVQSGTSVIGVAFDSGSVNVTYLVPVLAGIIDEGLIPFCIDPRNQSSKMIQEAVSDLGINFVIGDKTTCQLFRENKVQAKICDSIYLLELETSPLGPKYKHGNEKFAYVVQTSGTTGKRKTVFVIQNCIFSNVEDFAREFQLLSGLDKILILSPPTFDPFYVDLFLALLTGSRLVFASNPLKSDPRSLVKWIEESGATFMQMTPSLYRMVSHRLEKLLQSSLNKIKWIVLGGEVFPKLNATKLSGSKTKFYQAYGVTELSCWQSLYQVRNFDLETHPIFDENSPNLIKNTAILLDEEKNEIMVTSSHRKCLIFPSDKSKGDKISTGDLGSRDNGKIYFVDRCQNHFKICGKRTNLLEIESELSSLLNTEVICCQTKSEKGPDVVSVVAFLFGSSSFEVNFSQDSPLQNLPTHLMPSKFVCVSENPLPVTPHGKIDRTRLIQTYLTAEKTADFDLKEVWREALGSYPTATSNFITEGGDSVRAMVLLGRIEGFLGGGMKSSVLLDVLLNGNFYALECQIRRLRSSKAEEIEADGESSQTTLILRDNPIFVSKKMKEIEEGGMAAMVRGKMTIGADLIQSQFNWKSAKLTFKWKHDLEKCIDASPLLVAAMNEGDMVVYVGSHSGYFAALNFDDGELLWKIRLPDRIEASANISLDGKLIFVGCYDHRIYCLEKLTGDVTWSYKTGGIIKCLPLVIEDKLLFGSYDHNLYCINQTLGTKIWNRNLSGTSILSSPLSVGKGRVVVGTLDGTVVSLDAENGNIYWKRKLFSPIFGSPDLLEDTRIVFGTANGSVICLSALDGTNVWELQLSGGIFSSISIHSETGMIFVGCHDKNLYCISKLGQKLWLLEHPCVIFATPNLIQTSERKFVSSLSIDGTLKIRDLTSDTHIATTSYHRIMGEGEIFSTPVLFENKIVVGNRDNNLYCYAFNSVQ